MWLLDPERRTSASIPGGVRVTALWVQQALNAAGASVAEDGIAGDETFGALYAFAQRVGLDDVEPRAGAVSSGRGFVLLSEPLEAALSEAGAGPADVRLARSGGRLSNTAIIGIGVGALILIGGAVWLFGGSSR